MPNDKIMFDRYYCINSRKTQHKWEHVRTLYSLALSLTCAVYLFARAFIKCSIRAVVRFSWLIVLIWGFSTCFAWRPGTNVNKVAKPCIKCTWIALLINEFLSIKTWLLITCATSIYAMIWFNVRNLKFRPITKPSDITSIGAFRCSVWATLDHLSKQL